MAKTPPPLSPPSLDRTLTAEPRGTGDESYCPSCERSFPIAYNVCPDDGTRLAKLVARSDDLLGRVLDGRYEVRAALGAGGMGTVYRGCQLAVDRDVAIKVIHPSLASDRIAVKRFLREARLATRLAQANIVNVYDFGQDVDGTLYLVMELLRGKTLAELIVGPLPIKRVVAIGLQLCDALQAAHGVDIVHRDLKPGNIVILDDPPGRDHVKVLDFGLAKSLAGVTSSQVTTSNAIVGTPLYMAPEQVECKPGDHRTDLYALGCILYQMVTGAPMFLSDSPNLVLAAHLNETPPPLPLDANPLLVSLIEQLVAKRPDDRPPSALVVRERLEQVLGMAPHHIRDIDSAPVRPSIGQPAVTSISVTSPPSRRRRWPFVLAPFVIAGVAFVAYRMVGNDGADHRAATAASPVPPTDASLLTVEPLEPELVTPVDAGVIVDAALPDVTVSRPPRRQKPRRIPPDARRAIEPSLDAAAPADVDFIQPSP